MLIVIFAFRYSMLTTCHATKTVCNTMPTDWYVLWHTQYDKIMVFNRVMFSIVFLPHFLKMRNRNVLNYFNVSTMEQELAIML